jgi:hypothetical protein
LEIPEIYIEELKKDSGKSFVEQIIDASINYQKETTLIFFWFTVMLIILMIL